MPRLNSWCGLYPVISVWPSFIVPESGCIEPFIKLNKVVLPAPFGPMSAVIEDFSISRDTLSMAFIPPKLL